MAGPEGFFPSFFYADRNPGEPGSYESLIARRKIAESLMGKRSPYPKNIGEGIASLGEAAGDVFMLRDLERRERAQELYAQGRFDAARTGAGSYVPGAAPPAAAPPAAGGAALPPRPVSVDRARLAGGVADAAPETMELPDPLTGRMASVPIYAEKDWSPIDAAVPAAEIAGTRGLPMRFRNNSDVARYIGAERAQSTLTPDMRAGLVAAYNMMSPDERAAFVLNEGGRTPEQQAGYYNRPHTGMVAPPGGSYHQTGNAVDVDPGLGRDWLTRNAHLVGLEGLRGDPGHFQLPGGGPRSGLPLIPSVAPVAGGGREAITRTLAGRGQLGSGPEGDGSALSFAPAPARAPSPAPLPPTSATPLTGAGGDDRLLGGEGVVAALPPRPGGGGPAGGGGVGGGPPPRGRRRRTAAEPADADRHPTDAGGRHVLDPDRATGTIGLQPHAAGAARTGSTSRSTGGWRRRPRRIAHRSAWGRRRRACGRPATWTNGTGIARIRDRRSPAGHPSQHDGAGLHKPYWAGGRRY